APARHDPVVMRRWLAEDVHARTAPFVLDDQPADALTNAIPDALVQPHRRRDDHRPDATSPPAAILHGDYLRPCRAGQARALAAAVAAQQGSSLTIVRDE